MGTSKGSLFSACLARESDSSPVFGSDSQASREWESFREDQREGAGIS